VIPVVLFMAPDRHAMEYALVMNRLAREAMDSLNKDFEDVELIGFVSPNADYGAACLHFLGESGIDVNKVLGLILWGEAGDQFSFNSSHADSYVFGSVVLPDSLTSIPTLCIPSLETGWMWNPRSWKSIKTRYIDLLRNGRRDLTGNEPYAFITRNKINWN
jgi:hypothetical protein